jgi:hypothetical protein
MGGSFKRRRRVLGPREQAAYLRQACPWLDVRVAGGCLVARGNFGSVPWTRPYQGRIVYEIGRRPRTFIDDPALKRRNDGLPIPHVYAADQPCTFHPSNWSPDQPIALTVVPWLMTWLVFYEGWRVTGDWDGGGLHPPANDR